jgi:hypothetical protein
MGYYNCNIENKEWSKYDFFTDADLNRIVKNNQDLRKAFYVFSDAPLDAVPTYHYKEFNALERILYDLDVMATAVKSLYRECDTFECGE